MTNQPRDSLHEHFDRERLGKHGRGAEQFRLSECKLVRGADDDRHRRIALLHPSDPGDRGIARVRPHAHEVGDHEVRGRADHSFLESVDEREVIALVAEHLADEVSYVAVVLDDQDLSYAAQAADLHRDAQF